MAIYVTSDLHGTPLAEFEKLLEKAHFSEKDWLFVLGDVIDRGEGGGIELLEWLLYQPNAQLVLGNHEAMLLACSFLFQKITDESIAKIDQRQLALLQTYQMNGGEPTLKALSQKMKEDQDLVFDLLEYLQEAPIYETVSAGGKDFILVHAGFENFSPEKKLSDYTADELIWNSPRLGEEYFPDAITVVGHTPTVRYDDKMKGKILKTRTWIDVDAGVAVGCKPALLRLDDLAEFYL